MRLLKKRKAVFRVGLTAVFLSFGVAVVPMKEKGTGKLYLTSLHI